MHCAAIEGGDFWTCLLHRK